MRKKRAKGVPNVKYTQAEDTYIVTQITSPSYDLREMAAHLGRPIGGLHQRIRMMVARGCLEPKVLDSLKGKNYYYTKPEETKKDFDLMDRRYYGLRKNMPRKLKRDEGFDEWYSEEANSSGYF